jgi:hypothetical protein
VTPTPIVAIDHIIAKVSDPLPLYGLFTERLGLPVAWPVKDYGAFASGGVCLGNLNLELLRMGPPGGAASAKLSGVAFEPAPLATALPELARRQAAVGEPQPFAGLWTNVYLHGLGGADEMIFLCEYQLDIAKVNAANRAQLLTSGGGAIGLIGVEEVRMGAGDPPAAAGRWQNLLAPAVAEGGDCWRFVKGPAWRLVPAAGDGLLSVALRVASIDRARAALAAVGMAAEGTAFVVGSAPGVRFDLTVR